MDSSPTRARLERRNRLWQLLRAAGPGHPDHDAARFEATLSELSALIGWDRAQILAGLGLESEEPKPG